MSECNSWLRDRERISEARKNFEKWENEKFQTKELSMICSEQKCEFRRYNGSDEDNTFFYCESAGCAIGNQLSLCIYEELG